MFWRVSVFMFRHLRHQPGSNQSLCVLLWSVSSFWLLAHCWSARRGRLDLAPLRTESTYTQSATTFQNGIILGIIIVCTHTGGDTSEDLIEGDRKHGGFYTMLLGSIILPWGRKKGEKGKKKKEKKGRHNECMLVSC
jgi:hypothetical protein